MMEVPVYEASRGRNDSKLCNQKQIYNFYKLRNYLTWFSQEKGIETTQILRNEGNQTA